MAAEEDPSGFCLKQPLHSDSDALGLGKSGLEKKRSLLIKQGQMDYSNRSRIRKPIRKPINNGKLWELNWKKDVVCLILSYPPFNSRNIETHRGWIRDVLEITHKAREALKREKQVNISELSSKITGLLHHSIHDIEAHVHHTSLSRCVGCGLQGIQYLRMADLEIRRNHHLLSWKLFCENAGEVMSSIQQLAVHLLRQCSGHLLATVLTARALKDVKNVRIWQHASRVIGCLPTSHAEDRILFNALAFVLEHLGRLNRTLDEGEKIVQHLVNALLLESFQNGEWKRTHGGTKNETWEEANEMHLMNNKISKLLDNPNCPKLIALFLQEAVNYSRSCHLKLENSVISSLLQLEELSIDVNPEDERWNASIKDIVEEVCCLNRLHFLKLHLPEVLLLNDLRNGSLINLSLMHFRFIVGNHLKRIISRLPHESAIKFEEQESCLKYVNGKGIPIEIKEKCNEIETILDTGDPGKINKCQLELDNLEELVVEDCPEINTIMLPADQQNWRKRYLPNLKKISLHYLPKLVSIFGNVPIAPSLEWLSFYDCPSLKILFREEVSSHKLKVIIGEADWWSALNELEWFQPQSLGAIFFPIERDIDLRTQLTEINDQLQAQMQGTKPSQQSAMPQNMVGRHCLNYPNNICIIHLDDFLENPEVEAETSSE
ncbi:hypothetical protein CK203_046313 [Vitis vinifera]|uniref:Disease resistance protein n=1 Tax=Vitis vinifera TaxID=29760 RepID=A0A438FW62_VITVI|nr:hypothetical protein CK203_046313 [Vitis vinifera]